MKRLAIGTLYFVLAAFICSCGKTTCLNPGLHITYRGFDTSLLSRVLVEQYTSNSNFTTLIGVSLYDTANIVISQSSDTVYMPKTDTSGTVITPGYDYIVRIPAASRTYKISKISYDQVKRKVSGNGGCTNNVSYYLDTIPHKVSGGSYSQTTLPPVNIVLEY